MKFVKSHKTELNSFIFITLHFPGFEVRDGTDDGVKYLVKKHPEILMFKLRRGEFGTMFQLGSKFTSNGLLQILQFCGSTLRSLDISVANITGENLSEYKGTLPCLEILK